MSNNHGTMSKEHGTCSKTSVNTIVYVQKLWYN